MIDLMVIFSEHLKDKMRKLNHLLYISFLLAVSCCKEDLPPVQTDGEGAIIAMPYEWKYYLHESGNYFENGNFEPAIIYNGNAVIPTTSKNGSQRMTMINSNNGKPEWHWNDVYPGSSGSLFFFQNLVCNNYLIWQENSISLPINYCINLESGSTHWKIKREKLFETRIQPYGESKYFTTSYVEREDGYDEYAAFIVDIQTGELSEFLRANYSCEYAAPITENGSVGAIIYINQYPDNSNLLLVTYAEPLPEWKVKSMFGLYNTETQEWVYERKILTTPLWNTSVFHTPIIFEGRVYANVGNNIVCHDVMTGEQVWKKEFTQDFLFSGFIIEDGMLLANCEDTYTYRLNLNTGYSVWQTESSGTCSRISYLNGVAYFVGGSSGRLHAIVAETGKTVWRIDASKLEGGEATFTTNAVYCIPGEGGEKGKVIAMSGRYAYCFEAYQ